MTQEEMTNFVRYAVRTPPTNVDVYTLKTVMEGKVALK
jgi:hypothetical protein